MVNKKIQVGMYFSLKDLNGLDLSSCLTLNPGIGGTFYCQLTVAAMLAIDDKYEVIMYTLEKHILPKNIKQKIVSSGEEAIKIAKNDNVDIFIFIAKRPEKEIYEKIEELQLPTIAWVHNYIEYRTLKLLKETTYVKRIVFVGQQQYDAYVDDSIFEKSTFIFNIVPPNNRVNRELGNEKIVTYVGYLGKVKGFQILAKYWKYISNKVPNAKLCVIGSGKLYDRTQKYGKFGLAEKKYEELFMKYLTDKSGNLLDSVKFYGTLGKEKEDIYKKTYVGVVNPSGISETFCLSAVEFESVGIPVVTYRGYGLLDTVLHNFNGLTARRGKKQAEYIISLLNDKTLNYKLGQNGINYSREKFSPENIVIEWKKLIDDIIKGKSSKNIFSNKNYYDDFKWLKYINHIICKKIKILPKISVSYFVSVIKVKIKKILRR